MMHGSIAGGGFAPGGGSTVNDFLQPFTQRWSEARILSDCLNIKVTKINLYYPFVLYFSFLFILSILVDSEID